MSLDWNSAAAAEAAATSGAITEALYQDRITNLQIEIAKATDPRTRAELQTLLQQTQDQWQARKSRGRKLMVAMIVFFIALVIVFVVFAYNVLSRMHGMS